MLNSSAYLSQKRNNLASLTQSVGSSSSLYGFKRPYLSDVKPLTDPFTFKKLAMQVLKAGLLPANLALAEYNKFLMEQENEDADSDAEFDWNECLTRHFDKFLAEAQRFISVSIIRRFVEEICIVNCTPKIADKLTKDVGRSMERKLAKYSRAVAGQKILFTSLWASAISYSAFIIYDSSFILFGQLKEIILERKGILAAAKKLQIRVITPIAKKLVIFGLSWISSSAGFALGSYINLKYGGPLASLLLDLLATIGGTMLLGA